MCLNATNLKFEYYIDPEYPGALTPDPNGTCSAWGMFQVSFWLGWVAQLLGWMGGSAFGLDGWHMGLPKPSQMPARLQLRAGPCPARFRSVHAPQITL
jgi:hypothetical protein